MDQISVDLCNMNNKWVRFELANIDTFIIHIGFGMMNIDTIRILTRHEQHDLPPIIQIGGLAVYFQSLLEKVELLGAI